MAIAQNFSLYVEGFDKVIQYPLFIHIMLGISQCSTQEVFIFLTEVGNAGRIANKFGQLGIRNRALNT
jgi:hypothetical protein